jgi:hypothetical protein
MLIDAIIATAILAGAVIAAARIVTVASSLNIAARQTTLSAALAAGSLENLRARGTLRAGESGREEVLSSGTVAVAHERHLAYTVRWAVEALPDPSLVRVTVVVHAAGPGRGHADRSATLITVRRSEVR